LKPKEYKLNGPEGLENWYSRGKKAGKKVTKYRKGACANCGAMTHSQKDCVERPRKKGISTLIIGAKWTGEDIQQDEIVQKIELDFEGKRDRWNGYDPSSQLEEIEKWKIVEEKRLEKRKEKRLEKQKERELKRLENPNGMFIITI
jgi:pre-mRNA-processing factor SLU7